jgi:hypothetical protein
MDEPERTQLNAEYPSLPALMLPSIQISWHWQAQDGRCKSPAAADKPIEVPLWS